MSALGMENEGRLRVSDSELRGASVDVACQLVNGLATKIIEDHPDLGPVDQYRLIAESLPERVEENLQRQLLRKAQHGDTNATTAFLMLNLGSVFSKAEEYLNGDQERDDELVCTAILMLLERIPGINGKEQLKPQVHAAAREGIVAFLKQNEGANPGLTRSGAIHDVQHTADQVLDRYPWGTGKEKLKKVARNLVKGEAYPKDGPGPGTVLDYLMKRIEKDSVVPEESDDVEREVLKIFRHKEVVKQMDLLPEREQQALKLWAWENMTYAEIGDRLGFTKKGIREILERALRTLRHPYISQSYR